MSITESSQSVVTISVSQEFVYRALIALKLRQDEESYSAKERREYAANHRVAGDTNGEATMLRLADDCERSAENYGNAHAAISQALAKATEA